ncbi:MAG: Hsp70 family protein [Phycisphaeraceae bacterium]|nr:Hsp70 family protein [Phycisphaeraceae bacterium]
MTRVIGLDLGSSRLKASTLDGGGNPKIIPTPSGEMYMDSAVYIAPDGKVLTGIEARHMGLMDPGGCIMNAKRYLDSNKVLCKRGKERRAIDFVQIQIETFAAWVESQTGEPPKLVVVSIPANFRQDKRENVKLAAERAGLQVLLMPHEPTAGVFGAAVYERGDGVAVIIDVGGSTTDVTSAKIVGNTTQILTTNGLEKMGGIDFCQRVVDWALQAYKQQHGQLPSQQEAPLFYQELHERAEQAIHALSRRTETHIIASHNSQMVQVNLTRDKYAQLIGEDIGKIMDCVQQNMTDAGITVDDVAEFLTIGGPTLNPVIDEAFARRFNRKPWANVDRNFAVVYGNSILGRMELERQGHTVSNDQGCALPPLAYAAREVSAHPIGVAVVGKSLRQLFNSVLLPKGTPIPSTQMGHFQLAERGQTDVLIEILQGPERAPKKDCLLLGHFDMSNLTPVNDRPHPLEITMRHDKNGMITVEAFDPITNVSGDLQIDYRKDGQKDHAA